MPADVSFASLLDHPDFQEGRHWTRQTRASGETVFDEGDTGRDVFLILKGTVRVVGQVELAADRRIHPGICDLDSGAIFGELALFDDEPRSARVETLTDCEFAVIPEQSLVRFFESHPDIGYRILRDWMRLVVGRLRKTNRKVESLLAWGLKAHEIDSHL